MAALTTTFQILKQYPAHNARNHVGSLVGKTITVDPHHGRDFDWIYNPDGLGPRATDPFTVTADNECVTQDGSGIRMIAFIDRHSRTHHGNATRFNVVASGAGTTTAPTAPAAGTPKPYQPDTFGDIMDLTRRMFR
jgi:hypothetical protein